MLGQRRAELQGHCVEAGGYLGLVAEQPHRQLGEAAGRGRLEGLASKGIEPTPRAPVGAGDAGGIDGAFEAVNEFVPASLGNFFAVFVVEGIVFDDLVAGAAADFEAGAGGRVGLPGESGKVFVGAQIQQRRVQLHRLGIALTKNLKL